MGFSSPFLRFSSSQSLQPQRMINEVKFRPTIAVAFPQNPNFSRLCSRRSSNGVPAVRNTKNGYIQHSFSRRPIFITHVSKDESQISKDDHGEIAVGSAITVIFAVMNRVLYKLALVPMKEYPFFLAQVTTFGYVAIYFSVLYIRFCAGIVTKEMLALPKSLFISIGLLEALGVAAGMSAGAMLPGPAIPILSQTFLVWQLFFSVLILGRKYSFIQIFGCFLVAAGVVLAMVSAANGDQMLSEIDFVWPALMIASSAFQAGASILKEFVFVDASKRLKGKSLDIFVVNSFGSGFQKWCCLLYKCRGNAAGCGGAPWLPLLFITINMAFNISLLNLVKISSAVVSSLVTTLSVPISIFVLTLPLPYLPEGASLSPLFVIGCAILVCGLVLYNLSKPVTEGSESH